MNKVGIITSLVFYLMLYCHSSQGYADTAPKSFKGYWVYGYEQSLIETCDGNMFWMWVPSQFKGKYKPEGYRNPVQVFGYVLPPEPENNMHSSLRTLKVVEIKHIRTPCYFNKSIMINRIRAIDF